MGTSVWGGCGYDCAMTMAGAIGLLAFSYVLKFIAYRVSVRQSPLGLAPARARQGEVPEGRLLKLCTGAGM